MPAIGAMAEPTGAAVSVARYEAVICPSVGPAPRPDGGLGSGGARRSADLRLGQEYQIGKTHGKVDSSPP